MSRRPAQTTDALSAVGKLFLLLLFLIIFIPIAGAMLYAVLGTAGATEVGAILLAIILIARHKARS